MAYIKLDGFSGIAPRLGPTNLGPRQAQKARNLKLQSGELRPWRKPLLDFTPSGTNTQTIYKLTNVSLGISRWLEFSGDVNVVPGPVADTTEYRLYYTNGSAPKKTNWALATTSGTGTKPFPNASLEMGVPAPTVAPSLVKSGGSGTIHEDRVYIYTYVSTFGSVLEESAPSPATTIASVEPNATITVSGFGTAPTSSAGYNITAIRIYRSVTSGTTAAYLYVGTVSVTPSTGVASGSFSDTLTAAQLGSSLTSLYYTPPPATLQGLVTMPNGVLAGFVGNQVWFCEPYLPHAWPASYMMTVGAPIVGLGVFGQSLVVCTTSNPYLITGTTPGAMSQEKLPIPEPCVSKRSIASDQYGVLYASPNGVVAIGQGIADVVTRPLMTRDEWANYAPSSILGVIYQNMYVMFYTVNSVSQSLILTRGDNPPLVSLDTGAKAVFLDNSTASVYVVDPKDNSIYQLDADPLNNLFYEWTSKKFILPEPTNFAALKVQADWTYIADATSYNATVAGIKAQNQAIWALGGSLNSTLNATALDTYPLLGSTLATIPSQVDLRNVQVIVVGDDVQLSNAGITSQEPVRMAAETRAYVYEIKLTGNAPLREFAMATSIAELRKV